MIELFKSLMRRKREWFLDTFFPVKYWVQGRLPGLCLWTDTGLMTIDNAESELKRLEATNTKWRYEIRRYGRCFVLFSGRF